jgi:hypothetical protein
MRWKPCIYGRSVRVRAVGASVVRMLHSFDDPHHDRSFRDSNRAGVRLDDERSSTERMLGTPDGTGRMLGDIAIIAGNHTSRQRRYRRISQSGQKTRTKNYDKVETAKTTNYAAIWLIRIRINRDYDPSLRSFPRRPLPNHIPQHRRELIDGIRFLNDLLYPEP